MILDFRHPRIASAFARTREQAKRTLAVVVTDSLREANEVAKQWRRSRVAGELVVVRRCTRRVRAGGAAVELHVVVVSLRPPRKFAGMVAA